MNTHGATVKFGKYDGVQLVRVPSSYLRWANMNALDGPVLMANGNTVPFFRAATAELDRRGVAIPPVEITPHALDRFSQRHLAVFEESKQDGEGLFSWLSRIIMDGLESILKPGSPLAGLDEVTIRYGKIEFVVKLDTETPVVLTVK